MTEKLIYGLCQKCLGDIPQRAERCGIGQGNYVFIVECSDERYVFRLSEEADAYKNTVCWLKKLEAIEVPVPKVVCTGKAQGYEYLILTYLEGKDIGLVYPQLTDDDKRAIAKEIVSIQNKVAALELEDVPKEWEWCA